MSKKVTRKVRGAHAKWPFGGAPVARRNVGYRRAGLLSFKSPQSVLSAFSVGSC